MAVIPIPEEKQAEVTGAQVEAVENVEIKEVKAEPTPATA